MDSKELRLKSKDELAGLLSDLQGKLRVSKFEAVQGKLKNVSVLGEMRRDVARILTLLKEE